MGDALRTRVTPRPQVRQVVIGLVVALAVAVVVVLAIARLAGFAELGDAIEGARWQWLAACAVGQGAVFTGYAAAFRGAVRFEGGPAVTRRRSFRVILASFGLTQLIAAGGAAGLAITYWALRRLGFDRRPAVIRLIALNTAVYLVFALLAWWAAVLALARGSAPHAMTIPWLVAVPVVVALARWFTRQSRVERWTDGSGGRLRLALATGVAAAWWVRRAAAATDGRPVFLWAGGYWAGDLLSLWAALRAFGANPGVFAMALAYCTGYLAQAVPLPFIASGGIDAATTFALTAVGVPVELALLGVVTHRVFAFWLPIGPGLWSAVEFAREDGEGEAVPIT
ncbi:MAG: lysylphosphatidylglycerol synthase domain-containing protein [Acidimicrobiales bacterium]